MAEKITWQNAKRKLGELRPWERNPRLIKEDQAKRLLQSWQEYGQVEIIAVGPDNEIYNGHQRLNVLMAAYGSDYEVDVRVASRKLSDLERQRLIKTFTNGGEFVFEPFNGTGTTLIACERLGRKCRAVEISPAYCAVAIQRWVDVTGGIPALLD